jgi:hypothetical protein
MGNACASRRRGNWLVSLVIKNTCSWASTREPESRNIFVPIGYLFLVDIAEGYECASASGISVDLAKGVKASGCRRKQRGVIGSRVDGTSCQIPDEINLEVQDRFSPETAHKTLGRVLASEPGAAIRT